MFEIYKDLATLLGENNQNEIIRKLNLFYNAIYGFFVIYESLRKSNKMWYRSWITTPKLLQKGGLSVGHRNYM